ncbi:MAG: hypothetical protein H7Z72_09135 [Bacteroidetes bacterium]|nr:hypothetical protein [Fibrella sp.]
MFSVKAPMAFLSAIDGEWTKGTATFDALRTTVKQCMDTGHFGGHDREPLAFMIWGLVRGMCSLQIGCRADGVSLENPATIVSRVHDEFLKILEKL